MTKNRQARSLKKLKTKFQVKNHRGIENSMALHKQGKPFTSYNFQSSYFTVIKLIPYFLTKSSPTCALVSPPLTRCLKDTGFSEINEWY